MIGSRLIKSNDVAAACEDIVDNYDPFGDGFGQSLWQLNGTPNDVSGSFNGTWNGTPSYTTGIFGQAANFAGTQGITFADNVMPYNNFTISFWFKVDWAAVDYMFSFTRYGNTSFSTRTDGTVAFFSRGTTVSENYDATIDYNSSTNWHNIVFTKSSTSGAALYSDGQFVWSDPSFTQDSSFYDGNNRINAIGASWKNGAFLVGCNGSVDQVRLFTRALDPLEIEALYTEELCICGGTVDTLDILDDSSCIALYPLDGNANDLSGNYSGTPTNVSYGVGEFDLAGVFNGSTSNIQLPALGLGGNQSRSVSVWVKVDSLATTRPIFSYGDEQVGKGFNFAIGASGAIFVGYYSRDYSTTTTPITTNTWYHIVVTYNGGLTQDASNTGIYVNKVPLDKTSTGSYTGVANTTNTFYEIGQRKTFTNFDGQIDQVRIFNKALSAGEVTTLYNETPCN